MRVTLPADLEAVLRFEARHENLTDAELAPLVRVAFGLSLLRYRQRLARAVYAPGAEAVAPSVVRRLKAAVDVRRRRFVRRTYHLGA